MTPWLQDQDLTVWHGDALDVLRELPDESIDCVVTSPPYWGLRDYSAEGQLGLEPTPDQYVTRMVEVFREVRRVLAAHGTCWVNLGDSYMANPSGGLQGSRLSKGGKQTKQSHEARLAVREKAVVAVPAEVRAEGGDAGSHPASRTASLVGSSLRLKHKDLCGVPWRVAFALQADGWWLRSDIIWSKPNPMPESVTDRPTKSHEYVFLLTKGPRYWFDQEAVREPWTTTHAPGSKVNETQHYGAGNGGNSGLTAHLADVKARLRSRVQYETLDDSEGEAPRGPDGRRVTTVKGGDGSIQHRNGERWPNGGRNVRSVWEIATQPYPEAHFATFPEELARRCIVAGCPEWICGVCGKPRERIVESVDAPEPHPYDGKHGSDSNRQSAAARIDANKRARRDQGYSHDQSFPPRRNLGWSDCGHQQYRPGVVLDPFGGSGTVAAVARKHGRRAVLIELNEQYCELIARRTQQQSLFA